jgi:hypothetical protein
VNRKVGIVLAVIVSAIIVINLVAGGIDRAVGGREPSGVAGSSYGTQDTGLAGLTALLAHYGHPVTRARGEPAGLTFNPADTVFVVEPTTLTEADDAQLLEFVAAGGRLVIGGSDPFYVRNLRDQAPSWSPDGTSIYQEIDPRLGRVRTISTAARGSWDDPGAGTVVVHEGPTTLLTADRVGRGGIFFLADASPLENAYLAEADNAAFAVGLAGGAGRRVVFVEGVHGYGERSGLGALPISWRVALVVLALAAIVFAWARARRFGGPDRPARDLPPARAEYVRALAVSLERTHDPEHALAPMQQWARGRIAQAAHLIPDASPEAIDRAAIMLGFDETERSAAWYPTTDDEAALALGRLVARLSHQDGRTT